MESQKEIFRYSCTQKSQHWSRHYLIAPPFAPSIAVAVGPWVWYLDVAQRNRNSEWIVWLDQQLFYRGLATVRCVSTKYGSEQAANERNKVVHRWWLVCPKKAKQLFFLYFVRLVLPLLLHDSAMRADCFRLWCWLMGGTGFRAKVTKVCTWETVGRESLERVERSLTSLGKMVM